MRDLRDLSKLPANPEYWERLESRMQGRDGGTAGRREGDDGHGWWAPLARHAAALGGLAAAAGIAALLLVPPRTQGEVANPAVLFRPPDDPAMNAFLSSPAPPPLGSLLIRYSRSAP